MTFTVRRLALAALGLAASSAAAPAGWNNVGNLTCCDGPVRRAFRVTDDCPPPRTAKYETQYETRSYYEPVTVMKPERYVEEVPVKVKSYYWEPVQSYSYRSYYDPCSGDCQQVAVPRTSYVRKEECRTETRYLEKVRMVPVQVEREVTETRPVYTYYGPVTRKYGPTTTPAPTVDQFRGSPRINEDRDGGWAPIKPPSVPTTPGGVNRSKEPPQQMPKSTDTRSTPSRQSDYRFNALSTSLSKESGAKVFGEVTGADRTTPLSKAKLVFVNAANLDDRHYVAADSFGGFDAKLPAGEWLVYAGPGSGKADYISKFSVKDGGRQELGVVTK